VELCGSHAIRPPCSTSNSTNFAPGEEGVAKRMKLHESNSVPMLLVVYELMNFAWRVSSHEAGLY